MNRRTFSAMALAALLAASAEPAAAAGIHVERRGSENPVLEVAKSTVYGALAGLTIGIAFQTAGDQHDGEAIRTGMVIGTFVGLIGGAAFVATRPRADALLQVDDGKLGIHPLAAMDVMPGVGVKVRLAGVRW